MAQGDHGSSVGHFDRRRGVSRSSLYSTARRALQRGESSLWEAAEAMYELAETYGETQRAIAQELGCSHNTVRLYVMVWSGYARNQGKRPSFTDAMREARGGTWGHERQTPEAKARVVTKYLKDKEVADAPEVRKVQEQHVDRRLREEVRAANQASGTTTRTTKQRDQRRQSNVINAAFWFKCKSDLGIALRAVQEARTELARTGLPNRDAGQIIKSARALARACEQFVEDARDTGIGSAM